MTVIRDEPAKDSGLVENVPASSSASEELSLRVEISRLCEIEYLINKLVLRNDAEIAYLQQMLEKMEVSSPSAYKLQRSSTSLRFVIHHKILPFAIICVRVDQLEACRPHLVQLSIL
jgi:hypothetical protein